MSKDENKQKYNNHTSNGKMNKNNKISGLILAKGDGYISLVNKICILLKLDRCKDKDKCTLKWESNGAC